MCVSRFDSLIYAGSSLTECGLIFRIDGLVPNKPYITSSRMETKVLEDGSAYARIRSIDSKRGVQFLTIRREHDRNKEELRINSCGHDMSTYGSNFEKGRPKR